MKKLSFSFCVLFFSALLALGIASLALPGNTFSELENRTLKTASAVSSDVLGGRFQSDLEDAVSDQFLLRYGCVTLGTEIKHLSGRRDICGAYVCRGRLIRKVAESDVSYGEISAHAEKYARAADRAGIPLAAVVVPSASVVLRGELPYGAEVFDSDRATALISEAIPDTLDLRTAVAWDTDCFYRTDHHWTARGAYLAYRAWREYRGETPREIEEFSLETVTGDFYGSLYSKAPLGGIAPDTIEIPEIPDGVTVTADGKEIGVYDRGALSEKDKYKIFFGGNHGVLTIENPAAAGKGTLLVVKDSFANSLVPFLIGDHEKIVMIDERYATVDIASLATETGAGEIVIIKEGAFF